MSSKDQERMAEEDFNRVEDLTKAMKKMVKPVTCPICQCQVRVTGVPKVQKDGTKTWEYKTSQVRSSSLEHCPRCGNGKKQVEARLKAEADHEARRD